jgi:hypothetical protein
MLANTTGEAFDSHAEEARRNDRGMAITWAVLGMVALCGCRTCP